MTAESVSFHCVVAYYRTATATAKKERPVPNGIDKSIKTWFKMLFTGYLDMVLRFCLAHCNGLCVDGTILTVQLFEQLTTLTTNKGIGANYGTTGQKRHTHRQYMHMIFTLIPLPTQTAFMRPWQTAKLAQFAWVLPSMCLRFRPDWVWSWTPSSNNQSLWHRKIKQGMYPSPGNVSKTSRYSIFTVHLASTLNGLGYCGIKQFKQLPE